MTVQTLSAAVSASSYPGRGIVIGASQDGQNAVIAYFIMGRSENSRNRIFISEGSGIRTEAYDPGKLVDPSLIIYAPVRTLGVHTIVTNGDQTDTIFDHLMSGGTFESALRTRTFEPDAPNFTPRISGLVHRENGGFQYHLSILKSAEGNPGSCRRYFYEYDQPIAGQGHFIHTYRSDGNPIPSFEGEPEPVLLSGNIDQITDTIWQNLNEDNKVSLFVRFIDVKSGMTANRIVNRNV